MAASVEVRLFNRDFLVQFEQKVPVPSQLKERVFELVLARGEAFSFKPKVKRTTQADTEVNATATKALVKAKSQSAIQKPAKKATVNQTKSEVANSATIAAKPATKDTSTEKPVKERKALAPIVNKATTALKPKKALAPKTVSSTTVVAKPAATDKENDASAASSSLLNIAKGVAAATKASLKPQVLKPAALKPAPTTVATKPVPSLPKEEVVPEDGESDEARLRARQKQIEYGMNTDGYKNYVAKVPKNKRTKGMPTTPDKHQKCSKRSWDGQVRKWRRQLHAYDPAPASISESLDIIEDEGLSARFNDLQLGQSLKPTDAFSLEDKPRAIKVLQF